MRVTAVAHISPRERRKKTSSGEARTRENKIKIKIKKKWETQYRDRDEHESEGARKPERVRKKERERRRERKSKQKRAVQRPSKVSRLRAMLPCSRRDRRHEKCFSEFRLSLCDVEQSRTACARERKREWETEKEKERTRRVSNLVLRLLRAEHVALTHRAVPVWRRSRTGELNLYAARPVLDTFDWLLDVSSAGEIRGSVNIRVHAYTCLSSWISRSERMLLFLLFLCFTVSIGEHNLYFNVLFNLSLHYIYLAVLSPSWLSTFLSRSKKCFFSCFRINVK